jgi:hypothetical protein
MLVLQLTFNARNPARLELPDKRSRRGIYFTAAVFDALHHHGRVGCFLNLLVSIYTWLILTLAMSSPFETKRMFHCVIDSTNSRGTYTERFCFGVTPIGYARLFSEWAEITWIKSLTVDLGI